MCTSSACNWRSIAIAMREETNEFCSGLEEHCNENFMMEREGARGVYTKESY